MPDEPKVKKPRKAKAKKEVDPAFLAFCEEYDDRKKLLSFISKKALDIQVVGVTKTKLLRAVYTLLDHIEVPEPITPDYTLNLLYATPVSLLTTVDTSVEVAALAAAFKDGNAKVTEMQAREQCKCRCKECQPELIRRCYAYIIKK